MALPVPCLHLFPGSSCILRQGVVGRRLRVYSFFLFLSTFSEKRVMLVIIYNTVERTIWNRCFFKHFEINLVLHNISVLLALIAK